MNKLKNIVSTKILKKNDDNNIKNNEIDDFIDFEMNKDEHKIQIPEEEVESIVNKSNEKDKLMSIMKSIIRHKIIFEMINEKYEKKEKYFMLFNMCCNTLNSFLLSLTSTSLLYDYKESFSIVST
jgi:hypothetical protein